IVVTRPGVDPAGVSRDWSRSFSARVSFVYTHALSGFAATLPDALVARLRNDPRIASIVPDAPVSMQAQQMPPGINRIDADLSPTAKIGGVDAGVDQRVPVDVAVLDTGIDLDHPDLNVYTPGTKSCTGSTGDDLNGHGTHDAGIIGALDNSIGTVGVAPGARVWPVQVLDAKGNGKISNVICGIDYVTQHASEIEVANMSLAGVGTQPTASGCTTGDAYHDAICRSVAAGVTYVVAAGNNMRDAAGYVPAAYDEVITVSAMPDYDGKPGGLATSKCSRDRDDSFGDLSNFGADIDLIAPGVCIYSTNKGGGYTTLSGTSMAAAHVSGAAALYVANWVAGTGVRPTPDEVRTGLQNAGTLDWNNTDDRDKIKEKLVNVASF
ncbi:MAG TPA: S8 family serine peptidase, partial [Actinomycetota bacterium]|nr:S8 family serine peptidase [Actinomycetota bacterium]